MVSSILDLYWAIQGMYQTNTWWYKVYRLCIEQFLLFSVFPSHFGLFWKLRMYWCSSTRNDSMDLYNTGLSPDWYSTDTWNDEIANQFHLYLLVQLNNDIRKCNSILVQKYNSFWFLLFYSFRQVYLPMYGDQTGMIDHWNQYQVDI